MREFQFMRVSFYDDSDWSKEQFFDVSGYELPIQESERNVMLEVLTFCGVLKSIDCGEHLKEHHLEVLLLSNNISLTFLDSME